MAARGDRQAPLGKRRGPRPSTSAGSDRPHRRAPEPAAGESAFPHVADVQQTIIIPAEIVLLVSARTPSGPCVAPN